MLEVIEQTKQYLRDRQSRLVEKYGRTHLIYGGGKGKTTAALGLALRAIGNDLKVGFVQFMKDGKSGECEVLKSIPNVSYYCPGDHNWASLSKGLNSSQQYHALLCLDYAIKEMTFVDILVCDEILNVPLYDNKNNNTFSYDDINELIAIKPNNLELVLTGLYCPPILIESADYVSEICKIKHPFDSGIYARKGIEF